MGGRVDWGLGAGRETCTFCVLGASCAIGRSPGDTLPKARVRSAVLALGLARSTRVGVACGKRNWEVVGQTEIYQVFKFLTRLYPDLPTIVALLFGRGRRGALHTI